MGMTDDFIGGGGGVDYGEESVNVGTTSSPARVQDEAVMMTATLSTAIDSPLELYVRSVLTSFLPLTSPRPDRFNLCTPYTDLR